MRRRSANWVRLAALVMIMAACATHSGASFPGPSQLRREAGFTVVVDGTQINGEQLLVLGAQMTFEELRAMLIPRLEQHGWTTSSGALRESDVLLGQERPDRCIYYFNLNPGHWSRVEAIRENARFEDEAMEFQTVFQVFISNCG